MAFLSQITVSSQTCTPNRSSQARQLHMAVLGKLCTTKWKGSTDILQCRRSRYADFHPVYNSATNLQQQMYHVPQQRPQDPSVGQDTGHNYPRHDGGEGDADAEGER